MNFTFFIAKRYFLTKKRRNFVHIISWVSLLAVAIGTAALVIVLSVFNGFEDLILKMYNAFDPHIKITAVEGKVFDPNSINIEHPDILERSYILEEKVLLKYNEKEFIATVKGVSPSYKKLTNFNDLLINGSYIDSFESSNIAVVGQGVAYYLSMGLSNILDNLQVFVLNRSAETLLHPHTAFNKGVVKPVGIFSIHSEIDRKYIITPLTFIQDLANRENQITAIELKLRDQRQTRIVQDQLKYQLGNEFEVKNRLEQQEFLYKILNTEKLAVFLILLLILIISTFNIVGSLTMLMIDKKNDIITFKSFGVTKSEIDLIFFKKSMLTITSGALAGLVFGLIFALLQHRFGFISMGSGSFMIDAYPITIKIFDVISVMVIVFVIGLFASWLPIKFLSKKMFNN